ncbi:MAG: NADH-quinone oxidoreductase subunit H, partial [Actinomyces urogenitalis DORA_12]
EVADDDVVAPGEEADAFAGGFPVPPLPGQSLPLSPRARRAPAAPVLAGGATSTPSTETPVQEGTDD